MSVLGSYVPPAERKARSRIRAAFLVFVLSIAFAFGMQLAADVDWAAITGSFEIVADAH